MKITVGTLFLAVAIFLDYIELISSVEPSATTLAQLFPGYTDGSVLPPIKVFSYRTAMRIPHFLRIGDGYYMSHMPPSAILARGEVIIAWRGSDTYSNNRRGDNIQPLWKLFPVQDEKCWVFDTKNDHWVTLNEDEFKKLGFGHLLTLVETQEFIAAHYRESTGRPGPDERAHHHACAVASREVDALQAIEARKIDRSETTLSDSQTLIRERYVQAYRIAFANKQREWHFGYSS